MSKIKTLTTTVLTLCLLFSALPGFAVQGTVNINTADVEHLAYLPRVGPATALRIVEFRKENGPFKSPEDLMLVRGIGEKTFALMKPFIRISGDTTLVEKVRLPRTEASKN
jgi:competence protein ComEA